MEAENIKVLLVEDTPEYAELLKDFLSLVADPHYRLEHVENLTDALSSLDRESYNLVLLDLNLPDSRGYDTFLKTHAHSAKVPIVILTALDDERLAFRAVREGAQDYLEKGQISSKTVQRALRYAIERQRQQEELQHQVLIDDLTGLFNRRGFFLHGNKYLRLSQNTEKALLVLFADLDGLKNLNDRYGHHEGDRALMDVAKALKNTFREADILARIGGDEFAVMALGIQGDMGECLISRLYEKLSSPGLAAGRQYPLQISVGFTPYLGETPCSLEVLLDRADRDMYERKRQRKTSTGSLYT